MSKPPRSSTTESNNGKPIESKITRLEVLFAEQDYTIQTLNDVVSQQSMEISRLNLSLQQIQNQLKALKTDLPSDIGSDNERPPHY